MRHIRNENGWIKPLLVIGVLVLAVYAGIQFGLPYYRHSAFENDAKNIARAFRGNLREAKEDVYSSAQGFRVPIGMNDILVEKKGDRLHIQTSWSQTIDILGFYQKTVDFNVDVEE